MELHGELVGFFPLSCNFVDARKQISFNNSFFLIEKHFSCSLITFKTAEHIFHKLSRPMYFGDETEHEKFQHFSFKWECRMEREVQPTAITRDGNPGVLI